ncbi:MAG: glycosyltransferase family 2 protein [Anaerolineae bacterium]|nr:glycosyltransferase family 2 protein [Anaerolineae bacterium]MCB9108256.1 glycosyltransferase family 2 protein [Anaerolineales bacterium]
MSVVVIMPAYNAAKTLEVTYASIPKDCVDKIILTDDVSKDETVEIAQKLGLKTIIHVQNRGYGGNQKTSYLEALKDGAEIVIMLHPDNQYDATKIPDLIEPIRRGEYDMMIGSRFLGKDTLEGGMPLYKFIGNRFLTWAENLVLGQNLSEYHSGFRAYSRRFLTTIPFLLNSDDFVFDSEVLAQATAFNFKIGEIAVPTRYFEEASSINFKRSVVYGVGTLGTMVRYWLFKLGWSKSPQFSRTLPEVISRYHWAEIDEAAS